MRIVNTCWVSHYSQFVYDYSKRGIWFGFGYCAAHIDFLIESSFAEFFEVDIRYYHAFKPIILNGFNNIHAKHV